MSDSSDLVERVIAAFGGVSKCAKACGHRHVTTVDGWKRSGRIPSWRKPELIGAAERLGVTLPAEYVADAAAVEPPRPGREAAA